MAKMYFVSLQWKVCFSVLQAEENVCAASANDTKQSTEECLTIADTLTNISV